MTIQVKCPCKECLKYAICIGQKQLSCEDFYTFFNDTHDALKLAYGAFTTTSYMTLNLRNKVWDKLWDKVRIHMPNCQGLFRNQKRQKMPNYPRPTRVCKDAK